MAAPLDPSYIKEIESYGWELDVPSKLIWVHGYAFPLGLHPYQIALALYRDLKDPVNKLAAMKIVHNLLWIKDIPTWNDWQERIFLAHCEGHEQIVLAGGSGIGKSNCCAKVGLIYWLSDPEEVGVIVASTTLDDLESRIWGYIGKYAEEAAKNLPIPIKVLSGKPPKVIMPGQKQKISGIFAVAIREGQDAKVLSKLIGRHPSHGIMLILDESTDMNPAITQAFPNLKEGTEHFQAWAIGNSKTKNDLHGAMATPRAGWQSINYMRDKVWPTTCKNGICLYFNPYDSPAITHPDPVKRALLGKFLLTEAKIAAKKEDYGDGTEAFNRFCLGFWSQTGMENTLVTEEFAAEQQLHLSADWSGHHELRVCAGLDPAFQVGGTGCVLRLAILGQQADGLVVMDFRGAELLFKMSLVPDAQKAGERQLAEQVCDILKNYYCPVSRLVLDATGVGRALGELIRIVSGQAIGPHKIYSVKPFTPYFGQRKRRIIEPDMTVIPASDMWMKTRQFIEHKQLRGLDHTTIAQITSRLILRKGDRLIIETKKAYRSRIAAINPRLAHSPDEADAAILCVQSAINNFGFIPGQHIPLPVRERNRDTFFNQKQAAMQAERELESMSKARPRLVPNFGSEMTELAAYKGSWRAH